MATDWKALEQQYYMQCARRQPIVLVRGEGTRVWDENDNPYLDFTAGWAVNNLGHAHPVLANVITEQAHTLVQTSNQFYTIPQIQAAQLLVEQSCFDQVFFCNSGAEANEGAIKLARKYGTLHRHGAYEIITAFNSYHGRTLTTTAATGQLHYHVSYQPVPTGFTHVPFDDMQAIEAATTDRTVAILLEPVQGEGGVHVPSRGYLAGVRQWCDDNGLLLIFDEIQTGVARTGSFLYSGLVNIHPEMVTLAKGIASGFPAGALLVTEELAKKVKNGDLGSTFGGGPLSCATMEATLEVIEKEQLIENAALMGNYLKEALSSIEGVEEVRGRGLLLGVKVREPKTAKELQAGLLKQRILAGSSMDPQVLRMMPPLILTRREADLFVKAVKAI